MRRVVSCAAILLGLLCWGQSQNTSGNGQSSGEAAMPGMDMSNHDMSSMKDMPRGDHDDTASSHVMHSMEGHMDMGPHMKMTAVRQPKPGDAERARKIVDAARKTSEKYTDYHAALDDGFKIFLPNVPQRYITSRIPVMPSRRSFISILSIRHCCSMRNTGAITNSWV